jgi:F-box/leucine-rich repeat protein 14
MHTLRSLTLSEGKFSDAGLKELAHLTQLESLTMRSMKHATVHGFAFLSHLFALKELHLWSMPLNDEVLEYISSLTGITTLDLTELSGLTDAGILRLRTLGNVEWLVIQSCPKVTPAGIRSLKAALPGQYTLE